MKPAAGDQSSDDSDPIRLVQQRLNAEAEKLRREVERAADLFVERRKAGADRRRHSRGDRRKA